MNLGRIFQSMTHQKVSGIGNHRFIDSCSTVLVFRLKAHLLITIEQFFNQTIAGIYCEAKTRGHPQRIRLSLTDAFRLASHKRAARNNVIYGLNDLHIYIKIQTSIAVKHPKTGIVAHISKLPCLISFRSIRNDIDIKILFVPLLYLIVGQKLSPRSDTFLCTLGQRFSAKPTIMNYLRYHNLSVFHHNAEISNGIASSFSNNKLRNMALHTFN